MNRLAIFKIVSLLLILGCLAPVAGADEWIKRSKRMYLLELAGFEEEMKSLDELDQDLLLIRARSGTIGELTSKYPALKRDKLQKLQALLQEAK